MGVYTINSKVQALLDAGGEYNGRSDLDPFVEAAELLVDNMLTWCTDNSVTQPTTTVLGKIATWLGAHFYQQSDKGHSRRRTGVKEAHLQIEVGKGLDSTLYGQTAKLMDPTGYLASLDKAGTQELQVVWGGKRPSDQTAIWDRS